MTTITDLLARLESCYDAIPRVAGARAADAGPFVLFLREGPGWPFYARPRLGATTVARSDVEAVLQRQREFNVPRAIEWIDEVTPALLGAVTGLGFPVVRAPLMVLEPSALPSAATLAASGGATVSLLDPAEPSFADTVALSGAVASVGFGARGTSVGTEGPAERDAVAKPFEQEQLEQAAADIRSGERAEAVAATPTEGIVARGSYQSALGATEIVGVATLPAARRRGLGAAVSALLAQQALATGHDPVFLSAADEAVARVYSRIGFRRIGTACILDLPHI